jgi:hypothetical protein
MKEELLRKKSSPVRENQISQGIISGTTYFSDK